MKVLVDNRYSVARIMASVSESVRNIVRKGEIADNQHFLPFPQCFKNISLLGSSEDQSACSMR